MIGTVKFFAAQKGWGFIVGEDGEDVFVHHLDIQMEGYRTLDAGQRVEYEVEPDPGKGKDRAVRVRPMFNTVDVAQTIEVT